MTSHPTPSTPRRTYHRDPTPTQLALLDEVLKLLHRRRRCRNQTTFEILAASHFHVEWLRVRWIGGVGSYAMMRGGVMRILVSATKSGFSGSKFEPFEYAPSCFTYVKQPSIRRGFRYGWCVEVR